MAPNEYCCSSICFRKETLENAFTAIAKLGFRYIDIGALGDFCPHFDFFQPTPEAEEKVASMLEATGLSLAGFTIHIGELNEPEWDAKRGTAAGRAALDLACRLGAKGVNFNCGSKRDRAIHPFAADLQRVADGLRPLAEYGAQQGVQLWIEAPHRYNLVRTLDDTLDLIRRIDHPNAYPVMDSSHHHHSGQAMPESVERLGRKIGIVHLRDALGGGDTYPVGAGEIDFPALIRALDGQGYEGLLSFEFPNAGANITEISTQLAASIRTVDQYRKASLR